MTEQQVAKPNAQQIAAQIQQMKQELTAIAQKIGELETERDEHTMVIETLEPLERTRTCFRLIGGILVERNIEAVLPQIYENRTGIQQLMKSLGETYASKEKQVEGLKV